jgi:hypothetical protein
MGSLRMGNPRTVSRLPASLRTVSRLPASLRTVSLHTVSLNTVSLHTASRRMVNRLLASLRTGPPPTAKHRIRVIRTPCIRRHPAMGWRSPR